MAKGEPNGILRAASDSGWNLYYRVVHGAPLPIDRALFCVEMHDIASVRWKDILKCVS